MKSRTSCFNTTVFKKNITRFAPVWALYTVFLLLYLLGIARGNRGIFAREMADNLGAMAWLNLFYAGICAIYLFGDLFNSRLCNALHAFPLRREGWLITNTVSGILFSLVPNVLMSLMGCILMWEYAYIALIWLAVNTLLYLFFFGTAVFSAVCAGNRLATVAIYGIIHFITFLAHAIISLLYEPLVYGFQLSSKRFFHFFPMNELSMFSYVDIEYVPTTEKVFCKGLLPDDWRYLGICAGAGLVFFALAWLVYRCRHLESAGDFISLRPLSPAFLVIYTFGVGIVLYAFFELFGNLSYAPLAVGIAVGYFTGRMLLGRTVKVFGKKALLGFALLMAVLAGSMLLTWLDPLGLARQIPDADSIKSAAVYEPQKKYIYDGEGMQTPFEVTDRGEIEEILNFHKEISRGPADGVGEIVDVYIRYTLHNGKQIIKRYPVSVNSEAGSWAQKHFSDIRYIFQVDDPEILYKSSSTATVDALKEADSYTMDFKDGKSIAGLLDAIKADCAAGRMAQHWAFHDDKESLAYSIRFQYVDEAYLGDESYDNKYSHQYLEIMQECTNTAEYLDKYFYSSESNPNE